MKLFATTVLSLLVLGAISLPTDIYQGHFRWRNDDGSQTTATWRQSQDTQDSLATASPVRLRVEVYNPSPGPVSYTISLYYSADGSNYTKITSDGSTNAWALTASSNFADLDATTNQLTGLSNSFIAGVMAESSSDLSFSHAYGGGAHEYEFCIAPTDSAISGTLYRFMVKQSNGDPTGGTDQLPTLWYDLDPFVSSVSPTNNSLNISANTTIQATFSEAMLPGSFNDTTGFLVSGSVSGRHRGSIVLTAGNTVATFTPDEPFIAGERVEVALTSGLQNTDSTSLTPNVSSFTVQFAEALGTFTFDRSYTAGDSPFGIGVGDMDGDGYGDIATTNTQTTGISTFRHLANGYFDSKVDYATGTSGGNSTYPYSVVIADLNGDGASDMAVGNCNSSKLSILINNGDGTYAARVDYNCGSGPGDVAAADLDGDGDKDIAVAVKANNAAFVFMNNGDGTFADGISYTAGSYASGIAANDIDNDGDQDLVTANEGTNTLSVLKNDGDGTFASPVHLTAASGPLSVEIGDLNGDGFGDLVCGNQGGSSLSVFLNNGSGGFGSATNYALGSYGRGAALGDIDGDGDLDVVIAVSDANRTSVFLNNGDGTFASRVDYNTSGYPMRVAIVDVDRNGIADFVSTGASTDVVNVYRGLGTHDATLLTPTNITESSATLNGTVSVAGDTAVVRFLIGTTSGTYTDSVLAAQSPVGDSSATTVSGSIVGLIGQTTYYIRLAVEGDSWYVRSHEWSFSTASADSTSGFAMDFDGMNDYINVPYHSTLNPSQFTVELWARVDGGAGSWRTPIASRRASGSILYGYNMYASTTNRWSAWIGPGTTTWASVDGGPVTIGAWTHLAMTYDSTRLRFFVDGVLKGDTVVTFAANTANPLRFGSASDANTFYFNGRIDEVRIWNIARDSSAIRETMHRVITSPTSNLVGNWHFNEASGTTATDSDSGRVGTLTNFDVTDSYAWPASTIPAGPGTGGSASEFSSGTTNLGSATLTTTDDFDSPVDITFTELNAIPNVLPEGFGGVLGNSVFLINAFGSPGSFSVNLTLTFGPGVLDPGVDAVPASVRLYTRPSSSDGSWTEIGGAVSANSSTGVVTWHGLTSFSQFSAVFQESALPVQMTGLIAEVDEGSVRLQWSTVSEVDNSGWEVERRIESRQSKVDGRQTEADGWVKIGFVEGAGTSTSQRTYNFSDPNPFSILHFPFSIKYRLKQIDRSGATGYSEEITVDVTSAPRIFFLSQNYPNPFNPSTTIEFTLPEDGHATLKVFNMLGQEVAGLVDGELKAGLVQRVTFDADHLSTGIYFARLQFGNQTLLRRLMLVK